MFRASKIVLWPCGTALASAMLLCGSALVSPQAAFAAEGDALEEVTVTARKRNESIVDIPVAITVLSDVQMEKLDLRSTVDLANYVPSLQFSDFTVGFSRNDRGGARPLYFRGLTLGLGGSTVAAGGMFLDGAAVVGNEVPGGMDIGAVEVLRGPQSVYFGRSSMTGAVSYRTKAIPNEWKFAADATLAQRSTYSVEASGAGPIFGEKLGIRITALKESSDGYVTNQFDGSTLGDRSRQSISATLNFKPTDNLEFKLYGNKFEDDDGASATGFITTRTSTNTAVSCQPNRIQPPRAELVTALYTFCGEIPDPRNSVNYINTNIPSYFRSVIFNSPLIAGQSFDQKVGGQRNVVNSHLVANWKINDYLTFQSITGYHTNTTLAALDGLSQPATSFFLNNQYFYTITVAAKDASQEVRLSSDPERNLSWTLGANYIDAYSKTHAHVYFLRTTNVSTLTLTHGAQNVNAVAAWTTGFYGGLYYKMLDGRLNLSAEGRSQTDIRRDFARFAEPQLVNGVTQPVGFQLNYLRKKFNSFSPRVSADYDVGEGRKVYASYAEGNRPGGFNLGLKGFIDRNDPGLTAEIQSKLGVSGFSYNEEKLKIFEVGFKGYLPAGKGYFDINVYAGKLSDQQLTSGALIIGTTANPLGFTVTATGNVGEIKMKGLEWQGNYNFNDAWSLATTAAWNDTDRSKFPLSPGAQNQYGINNPFLNGVSTAFAPKVSGSAVLSYDGKLRDWDFFSSGAVVYRGKTFMDAGTLAFIGARTQFDLRAGISKDIWRLEAFVLNAFDDQHWVSGNVATDFSGAADAGGGVSGRGYAFFGGAAPPRQVGVRVGVTF